MKQTIIRFLRIGVGIASTDVEYADSTSHTEAPTSGWQTTAPKWVSGHFVWSRTHIYYTDGRERLSDPVCLPTGKGIASIVEQYYKSTSSTRCTGGSWSNTAPTWQTGYYIFTRSVISYTDGTSSTTQPICATGSKGDKGEQGDPGKDGNDGMDGKDGADGQDAVTITMTIPAIVHHKTANSTRYSSLAKVFEGSEQVNFTYSIDNSVEGLTVTSVPRGKSRYFYFEIAGGAIVNTSVKISIYYDNIEYTRYVPVTTVSDGEQGKPGDKGDRGAVLRGPQLWTNCGEGYCFEAGEDGKEWKDTVIYNNSTYSCIKSHVKTTTNYPGSDEDINNGYWRVGSPIELIVANIIMSRYQLVKNLGVETIEMRDAEGNVIFQAKDGNVLANKGTFNNVDVSGTFFSRDPKTWNEIEIDAYNGGLTMRGPSNVDDDNNDLPSGSATLKDLLKIYFDVDADSLSRYALMKLFGKDNNYYASLDANGEIRLSTYTGSIAISADRIYYADKTTGKTYDKNWSDLLK